MAAWSSRLAHKVSLLPFFATLLKCTDTDSVLEIAIGEEGFRALKSPSSICDTKRRIVIPTIRGRRER